MKGETIKALRIFFGLSQRQLAELIGITSPYLCMLESSERKVPDTIRIKITQRFEFTDELVEALRRSKHADTVII
jgi:transcriptional regulator with XRE-family HTH domain